MMHGRLTSELFPFRTAGVSPAFRCPGAGGSGGASKALCRQLPKLRLRGLRTAWLFLLLASAAVWAAAPADAPVITTLGTGDPITDDPIYLFPSNVWGREKAASNDIITWGEVSLATQYRVQVVELPVPPGPWLTVSSNGNFVQQTERSWTHNPAFATAHTYGARVQAGNADGWGPYSEWMNFVIGPAAPPSIGTTVVPPGTLDSETGFYAGVDARPTIQWYPVDGATVYYMLLYDRTTVSSVLEVYQSGTTWYLDPVTYPNLALSTSHIYTVSVAAGNDFGWTWHVVNAVVVWVDFVVGPDTPPGQPTVTRPDPVADNVNPPLIAW